MDLSCGILAVIWILSIFLEDEQVLSSDLASTLKSWVQLRERLIRYYTEVRQEELLRAVTSVSTVRLFIQSVERYLEKELR